MFWNIVLQIAQVLAVFGVLLGGIVFLYRKQEKDKQLVLEQLKFYLGHLQATMQTCSSQRELEENMLKRTSAKLSGDYIDLVRTVHAHDVYLKVLNEKLDELKSSIHGLEQSQLQLTIKLDKMVNDKLAEQEEAIGDLKQLLFDIKSQFSQSS
jgi:hypothetical protein